MRRGRFRPATGAVFAMLTAAAVAHLVLTALAAGSPSMRPAAVLTSIALTDDDSGKALFPGTALAPGRPVARCIRIDYSGSAPADRTVRLAARNLRGDLVPRLAVRVEVGTGGGFAGCDGFQGRTVYAGGLGGLGTAAGVDTGWTPSAGDARTYRLTVTLAAAPRTGAGRAAATLEWLATASAASVSPAPAGGEPAPAASPSSPRMTTAPVPAVAPGASATAPDQVRPSGGTSSSGQRPCLVPMPSGWRSVLGPRFVRGLHEVGEVARRSGRDVRYPLAVLVLLMLFFLVQRRIDRSDPKLALAPIRAVRHTDLPGPGEAIFARPGDPTPTLVGRAVPDGETGPRHAR